MISTFITKKLKIFNFVLLTSFLYIGILFIVYLSTPFEINWHLSSSSTRVIKPIILLLFIFGLYSLTNKTLNRSSSRNVSSKIKSDMEVTILTVVVKGVQNSLRQVTEDLFLAIIVW